MTRLTRRGAGAVGAELPAVRVRSSPSRSQMSGEELLGRLATGSGQGKHFTRLDWARQQFLDKLGIEPFPGTINLIVDDSESMKVWNRLKGTPGVRIDNPNDGPHDCDARCYPVSIDGQRQSTRARPRCIKG